MITLGRPQPDLPSILESNGFAWWYLDLIGPDGDGLVLIWSYGLPMMPGTAAAERAGELRPAAQRPALNIATYARGECTSYLLEELDPADVRWDGRGRWSFGATTLATQVHGDTRRVRARVDAAIPGTSDRLVGHIDAALRVLRPVAPPVASSPHQWRPLGAAGRGRATLSAGAWHFALRGRAYHDRNSAPVPLGALGIARWVWARVPVPGGERIAYLLWPEGGGAPTAWGFDVDRLGWMAHRALTLRLEDPRRGRFGMPWWRRMLLEDDGQPWLELHHRRPLEDGPFYLRFHAEAHLPDGSVHPAVSEALVPSRRDGWARPLTEMAVNRVEGSSRWLPLFNGPAATRWSRLIGLDATIFPKPRWT